MKRVAIIILNWNGIELLKKFLPTAALYSNQGEAQLIVADNGSTDESCQWIKEHMPEVKLLKLDRNYGFAEGYNRAIAATGYEYTILLNSDVEVTRGWWKPLLEFMDTHPEAGACQPKIRSWRHKEKFEYAGAAGGYLDRLGYPYCRGRIFENVETDHGQYDGPPMAAAWASGAALMVRTAVYQQLGGLDPLFFAHMEEIDLCCRMWGAGHGVYALSDTVVYHVGGASLNQGNPKKTYLNFRNNLLLLHKNLPKGKGRRKLFVRRLADTLAFGMFLMKGDFKNAKAVLKAHRDFRQMKRNYTEFPASDYMSTLPGYSRIIITEKLKPSHYKRR